VELDPSDDEDSDVTFQKFGSPRTKDGSDIPRYMMHNSVKPVEGLTENPVEDTARGKNKHPDESGGARPKTTVVSASLPDLRPSSNASFRGAVRLVAPVVAEESEDDPGYRGLRVLDEWNETNIKE
jgi:hypothetical protein